MEGPPTLYVDDVFIESFLLGTLGIYPKGSSLYSFLLKGSFYKYVEYFQGQSDGSILGRKKRKVVSFRKIEFIPTKVDPRFKIIGEGEDQFYLLDIYQKLRGTSVKMVLLNYQWTSSNSFASIHNYEEQRKKQRIQAIEETISLQMRQPEQEDSSKL